jgi:co-chaperonin GroES (HSP10)
MSSMAMRHDTDPKKDLLKKLGDISDFELFNNMVLLAIYERPEVTAKGIILTQTHRAEDKYQGKAALIVKMGPVAFKTDGDYFTNGGPKVGDWIAIRPSDGWPIAINGTLCRMLADEAVKIRIPAPDSVY